MSIPAHISTESLLARQKIPTACKLKGQSIVLHSKGGNRKSKNLKRHNRKGRTYNGYMSPATASKVKGYIDNFNEHLKFKSAKRKKRYLLTFVTLTLSAFQTHSDNEVKRSCLNRFIIELRRRSKIKNYIWRAEPQKNGNIHFHIVIDKYIDHRSLRNLWNECQESLGYITEFEKLHGHRNPNSTDIHAVEKVRNIGAYMSKYMCKSGEEYETRPGEKKIKRRKIEGRIWGCSDSIRETKPFECEIPDVQDYIDYLRANDLISRTMSDEHFTVYYLKKSQAECLYQARHWLYSEYFFHHLNQL